MIPNIGSGELLIVAVLALIVIRPKELPAVLRTVGKAVGAVKRMAEQFKREFNNAVKESELENLRQDFVRETNTITKDIAPTTNTDQSDSPSTSEPQTVEPESPSPLPDSTTKA